ncbi:MAG: hypothetical protein JEZ06_13245 [Anaerolineaceae bacterium]|nr:hypothetical protein [Anaerolineaceae bacterium]
MFNWFKKKPKKKVNKNDPGLHPEKNHDKFLRNEQEKLVKESKEQTLGSFRIPEELKSPSDKVLIGRQVDVKPPVGSGDEARVYLQKVKSKITSLAERFAAGQINRNQFEDLHAHYQSEISTIEQLISLEPDSEKWKQSVAEGQSILIKRRRAARFIGFSIYENQSGLPVETKGDFGVDPALFVPMLYAYQSATQEIFGSGMKSTQIEGGKWLCFAPGKFSTTLGLFSIEPSGSQIEKLGDLHQVFERANAKKLKSDPIDHHDLVIPHDFFINKVF